MFHPRPEWSSPPSGATDHLVPVAEGVAVACRFYRNDKAAPSILYFHGNGEVVRDHDSIAPFYQRSGLNLFVADYRGYGASGGLPNFSTMLSDARRIFEAFRETLVTESCDAAHFVMGRSLGALSAVEVAAHFGRQLRGLIIESGAAGTSGWSRFAPSDGDPSAWQELQRLHLVKVQSITIPVLSIHAELDELIPLAQAVELQEIIGSSQKQLIVIPAAGHNDIMHVGMEQYFTALRKFISENHCQGASLMPNKGNNILDTSRVGVSSCAAPLGASCLQTENGLTAHPILA